MRKGEIGALAVMVVILLLSGCGGLTASLLGDQSSEPARQAAVLPVRLGSDLSGLATLPLMNWRPFSSNNLQVTIDLPPAWEVKEQKNGVAFTSPEGTVTQLVLVGKSDLSGSGMLYDNDLPGVRCSTATNAHGVTVRACFDELAESCTASFLLGSPEGETRIFSLLAGSRSNIRIFEAMLASIRPLGS